MSIRKSNYYRDDQSPIRGRCGKFFENVNRAVNYLSFIRCTGRSTNTPRQQVNKLTSYIDGSVVYGESEERNKALREFKDGKLKVGPGDLLPVSCKLGALSS